MTLVNLLDIVTAGRELPDGYQHWGIRSVHPDLRSSNGYRWPYPGNRAFAPGPILEHRLSCPGAVGDGICVATDWAGMASGNIPAITLLLCAYADDDVIGDTEPGKLRLRTAYVVDIIDGQNLLRTIGRNADLQGAHLRGANLWGANLRGAHLWGANLWGANLSGADLRSANLWSADLWGANLSGADLRSANLWSADLRDANLRDANLQSANLRSADLRDANLQSANLRDADLRSANLRSANGYTP